MATTAQRIRTSLLIGAATGTLVAALAMSPSRTAANVSVSPVAHAVEDAADDGMVVKARFLTSRLLPEAQIQNLAVTITAPGAASMVRPPLSLAIVIDRSGSMHGAPIENARSAALAALRQLAPSDAFSIISYSTGSEVVLPIQAATDANKTAARAAIESIYDDGGTCISCGLESGAAEVGRTPVRSGLRRILLISDGQANEGLYSRDELAQLAANKAERGVSISTVGVGLDFDETTMRRLAEVGRGNYYFIEDTVGLSAMFNRELGSLGQTVATDVRLVVTAAQPYVQIEDAYGYPMTQQGHSVVVPIADLRAGETRKVVLRVAIGAPGAPGANAAIAKVDLGWHRVPDGEQRAAHTAAIVDLGAATAAELAATADRATAAIIEQALESRALEQAATAYEKDGLAGARRVLDDRKAAVRAQAQLIGEDEVQELDAVSSDTLDGFTRAPAKAKKAASVRAYDLAR
ncbi:MAG TPA: VWA domain-containing protein [Kofleriaceae bacterium]